MGLMLTHALPAAAQYSVTLGGFINGSPATTSSVNFHLNGSAPDLDTDPTVGSYDAIYDLHGSVSNGLSFSTNSGMQDFIVQNNSLGVQEWSSSRTLTSQGAVWAAMR